MLKKVLLGIVAVVVLFLGFVATRPSSFTVTRSTTINAPADAVYAQVSDFAKWPNWSPWEELDPGMKKELTGEAGKVGATYHWTSDKDDVGEGQMTITAVKAPESIDYRLDFIKPYAAVNQTDFKIVSKGATSDVTWTMNGPKNFFMKGLMLFMDVEGFVGKDFEKGLGKLKTVAEAGGAGMAPMTSTTGGAAATTTASGPK